MSFVRPVIVLTLMPGARASNSYIVMTGPVSISTTWASMLKSLAAWLPIRRPWRGRTIPGFPRSRARRRRGSPSSGSCVVAEFLRRQRGHLLGLLHAGQADFDLPRGGGVRRDDGDRAVVDEFGVGHLRQRGGGGDHGRAFGDDGGFARAEVVRVVDGGVVGGEIQFDVVVVRRGGDELQIRVVRGRRRTAAFADDGVGLGFLVVVEHADFVAGDAHRAALALRHEVRHARELGHLGEFEIHHRPARHLRAGGGENIAEGVGGAEHQVVGGEDQADEHHARQCEDRADEVEVRFEQVGGRDAHHAAVALGEAGGRAVADRVDDGRERHRQQHHTRQTQPQIADAVLRGSQEDEDAGEKQHRVDARPDGVVRPIGELRPGRAAEVRHRRRVRIDGVARRVERAEADRRQERERPHCERGKQGDGAKGGALHGGHPKELNTKTRTHEGVADAVTPFVTS